MVLVEWNKKGVGPGKKKYDPWKKKLKLPSAPTPGKKNYRPGKKIKHYDYDYDYYGYYIFFFPGIVFFFPVSSHKRIQTASPMSCLERDQGGRLPGAISQKEILLQRHVQTSQRCSFSEDWPTARPLCVHSESRRLHCTPRHPAYGKVPKVRKMLQATRKWLRS